MADLGERPLLMAMAMRKRRTWVALFLLAYAFLIFSSWNVLLSIRTWYNNTSSSSSGNLFSSCWPALYASVLYGVVFGVLSMAAAAAIAVPATLVTWITVLVLLAFAGKPLKKLVKEGREITTDIAGVACRILIREEEEEDDKPVPSTRGRSTNESDDKYEEKADQDTPSRRCYGGASSRRRRRSSDRGDAKEEANDGTSI